MEFLFLLWGSRHKSSYVPCKFSKPTCLPSSTLQSGLLSPLAGKEPVSQDGVSGSPAPGLRSGPTFCKSWLTAELIYNPAHCLELLWAVGDQSATQEAAGNCCHGCVPRVGHERRGYSVKATRLRQPESRLRWCCVRRRGINAACSSSGLLPASLRPCPTLGSAHGADSVNRETAGTVARVKSNMPMYLYQFPKEEISGSQI